MFLTVIFHWCFGASLLYLILMRDKVLFYINKFTKILIRDILGAISLLHLQFYLIKYRIFNTSVIDLFYKTVNKFPNKIAFRLNDESWTFKELDDYSNKVANYFSKIGFKYGDEISILLENKIEYVGIWVGLAKIGVVPAFINVNQKDKALVHAICSIDTSGLIFSSEYSNNVNLVLNDLQEDRQIKFFLFGDVSKKIDTHFTDLKTSIEKSQNIRPSHKCSFTDKLYYIYTSGTTGYPKASVIKHFRFLFGALGTYVLMHLTPEDIIYSPLPIYHSVSGLVGTGLSLVRGITVIFKPKFSASQFWPDCRKYKCTGVQYVGELCRYLLATPESSLDKQHNVRIFFGNGLRKTFWKPLKERFNLKNLVEFFGSTEGNASLINFSNKEGACGFLPYIYPSFLVQRFYPLHLVKYDQENETVIRNEKGFCIACKPGESGMLISLVGKKDPIKTFDGYTNKKETEKKMISHVFVKGDRAFMTGDLMNSDEENFLYFADRVGDTFRWKGENVSTTEVENIISSILDFKECVVTGVEIPGHEGRAGMLTLTSQNLNLKLNDLLKLMKEKLPNYSLPLFIRLAQQLDTTSTFKFQKVKLRKEGFNIDIVKDPIYVLDVKNSCYNLLNQEIYDDILQCNVRF